jgi:hypothetical protein
MGARGFVVEDRSDARRVEAREDGHPIPDLMAEVDEGHQPSVSASAVASTIR